MHLRILEKSSSASWIFPERPGPEIPERFSDFLFVSPSVSLPNSASLSALSCRPTSPLPPSSACRISPYASKASALNLAIDECEVSTRQTPLWLVNDIVVQPLISARKGSFCPSAFSLFSIFVFTFSWFPNFWIFLFAAIGDWGSAYRLPAYSNKSWNRSLEDESTTANWNATFLTPSSGVTNPILEKNAESSTWIF